MSVTRRTTRQVRAQWLRGSGFFLAFTVAGACGGIQTEGAAGKDAGADAGRGSLGATDAGAADRTSADAAAEAPSVLVRLTVINACSLAERTGETITVPPVTVLLDNQPLVEDLPFGAATSALAITVRPQRSRIEARAGRSQSPPRVIDGDIENDDELTVVLSGSDCRPLLLGDEFGETAPDAVRVRFVDASTIGQQAPARLLAWNAEIGEFTQLTAAPLRGASPPAGDLMEVPARGSRKVLAVRFDRFGTGDSSVERAPFPFAIPAAAFASEDVALVIFAGQDHLAPGWSPIGPRLIVVGRNGAAAVVSARLEPKVQIFSALKSTTAQRLSLVQPDGQAAFSTDVEFNAAAFRGGTPSRHVGSGRGHRLRIEGETDTHEIPLPIALEPGESYLVVPYGSGATRAVAVAAMRPRVGTAEARALVFVNASLGAPAVDVNMKGDDGTPVRLASGVRAGQALMLELPEGRTFALPIEVVAGDRTLEFEAPIAGNRILYGAVLPHAWSDLPATRAISTLVSLDL